MNPIRFQFRSPAPMRGVTLIELMVALVLGLIVTGAALTLFVTNRKTYTASESLGRIQESQRTAFELMSRDVREGAGNACEKGLSVANVVNSPSGNWYTDFAGGIKGYDGGTDFSGGPLFGTTKFLRVAGTDAIELKSSVSSGLAVVTMPGHTSSDIKVNDPNNDLHDGDIAMVCNFDHAAIFQITNVNLGVNVVHNNGTGTPGNCSKGLGFPTDCTDTNGNAYDFGDHQPAVLAKLRATRWYIGYNGRTYNGQPSRSLYLSNVKNTGGTLSVVNNEITQGVRDMQLTYLVQGASSYVGASAIATADWAKVVAVSIDMVMEGEDKVGTDQAVLQRGLQHIVTLRNRAL
ncbi:PilW family protein [Cognatiluteimonas profundi]|uniref:PilW family protein n=1 Tax=Cognatiluteimonas profundi TaxID=2594501 RepID=UPI00131D0C81|nr:PilW family protein [Lysobacter profundi]